MKHKTTEDYISELREWKRLNYPAIKVNSEEFPNVAKLMSPFIKEGTAEFNEVDIYRAAFILYETTLTSMEKDLTTSIDMLYKLINKNKKINC
jgi:hypothetical protein